jgi:hypothetical protein
MIGGDGEATPTENVQQLSDEAVAYYQTAFKSFKEGELKAKTIHGLR